LEWYELTGEKVE
jgi:hypothetical protein